MQLSHFVIQILKKSWSACFHNHSSYVKAPRLQMTCYTLKYGEFQSLKLVPRFINQGVIGKKC